MAIAYVIDPSIFETELMRVDIGIKPFYISLTLSETSSELSSGRTLCDIYHMSPRPKNAYVGLKVDVPKFWRLMLDALKKANEVSVLNSQELVRRIKY